MNGITVDFVRYLEAMRIDKTVTPNTCRKCDGRLEVTGVERVQGAIHDIAVTEVCPECGWRREGNAVNEFSTAELVQRFYIRG